MTSITLALLLSVSAQFCDHLRPDEGQYQTCIQNINDCLTKKFWANGDMKYGECLK